MGLILHFLLGLTISFVGTIPPSMLNMTAAKISIEQTKREGLKFALGVSMVVFAQAYTAILAAKYIHNNADFEWYITVFGIFIFALLSIYFFIQAKKEKKSNYSFKVKNSFRTGVFLAALNMFAIPFYFGVGSALNTSGWINFEKSSIIIFVLGSAIGTYALLYIYAQLAVKIREKASTLTKNLNYILSILTGVVAIISLLKVL